jgi:hypothetical protein
VNGTVEQVMSGELFTGLLLDDTNDRAAALEALLSKVVDDDTRVIWVGNPLRSPLTIERFLIQIVGPEVDLREERGPAELAQIVAKSDGQEGRLLIVVQQPETINTETLHLLVQMGWYLGGEAVQVQFVFAGSSSFVVPRFAKPDSIANLPIPSTPDLPPAPRRRDVLPLVLLLLSITIGVVFSMVPTSSGGIPQLAAATPPANGTTHPHPAAVRWTRAAAASDRSPAVACP